MAHKIKIALDINGAQIPSDSIVTQTTKVWQDRLFTFAENGDPTLNRVIKFEADLKLYASVAAFQAYPENTSLQNPKEFDLIYRKDLTLQEYSDLNGDGSLAEKWVSDYLKSKVGAANVEPVDAFQ